MCSTEVVWWWCGGAAVSTGAVQSRQRRKDISLSLHFLSLSLSSTESVGVQPVFTLKGRTEARGRDGERVRRRGQVGQNRDKEGKMNQTWREDDGMRKEGAEEGN